jgi:hypothetical protein
MTDPTTATVRSRYEALPYPARNPGDERGEINDILNAIERLLLRRPPSN